MRDPAGRVTRDSTTLHRHLHDANSPEAAFLRSPIAAELVAARRLVPFAFTGESELQAPLLPFVSLPGEWCDAQLRDAGRLTLDISRAILPAGHELKDASAWNVLFEHTRPVFCDHLSFQPIARRQWWAFGQFTRHFAFPLAVSRVRRLHAHRLFATYRDGVPVEAARGLLGAARFRTRLWPLLVRTRAESAAELKPAPPLNGASLHGGVYDFCDGLLRVAKPAEVRGAWSEYTSNLQHYGEKAAQAKRAAIGGWLSRLKPATTLDLGCNTGEFSRLAADAGSAVIAADFDHDAVQRLYEAARLSGARIHPVIADLGDTPGGRGWAGAEFQGLIERLEGQASMVMMLALLHHLMIAEGITLPAIAALAMRLTSEHAIVELIDPSDPKFMQLSVQRSKDGAAISMAAQQAAFLQHFKLLDTLDLPGVPRRLLLLRRSN